MSHRKKHICKICKKELTFNKSYIGSHVKRKHNISCDEYLKKYKIKLPKKNLLYVPVVIKNFKNITDKNFKLEKCGFCNKKAKPHLFADFKNKVYKFSYDNGYSCESFECKNKRSQKYLKCNYNHKYEHIGSISEYTAKLHKKDINDVKFNKTKGIREEGFVASLQGFVKKYGYEKGLEKYNKRNEKIAFSNTLKWYILKYGEIKGNKLYNSYRKKIQSHYGATKSKLSLKLEEIFKELNINFISEYVYNNHNGKNGKIDFVLKEYNIAIEIYGDFWHCNPNIFSKDYFHKILKRTASDIWEEDKKRIEYIHNEEFANKFTTIILWETTFNNINDFLEILEKYKNKKTIIYL